MTRHTVQFEPEVSDDIDGARDWYADQREGLNVEFVGELQTVLSKLVDRPEAFPPADLGLRRARLERFPYSGFFRVRTPAVTVIGVIHDKRDPTAWRSRV